MGLLRSFRNLRLGVKVMTVAFLALVALQTAVMIVVITGTRRLTVQAGQNRVEQEAAVIQDRFEKAEQDILASTKLLASRPGLVEAVTNQDATTIRTTALVGAAPLDLDEIDVVGPDGAYIATMLEEGGTLHAAQQAPLISLALLGVESTGAIVDEEEAALWLAAAIPLRDASGAIAGALLATRRVDDGFLEERNFYRNDVHLALVADGHILAQDFPSPELLGETSAALLDETAIEQALSGQTLVADDLLRGSDGTPYALAYTPLVVHGDTVATIGIVVDLGQLRIFERQLTISMAIIFTALTLAAVSGLGIFVRRTIALPIGRLRSAAERMTSGDYQQRAQVTTTDEIGQLAGTFNSMAAQLQQTLAGLEQHAADLQRRSTQLEAAAEVARAATAVLDPDELLRQVVGLVRERFHLYYVGLFLLDEERRFAVLRAGTGEAGRKMLAQQHRLEVGGDSMVGQCTARAEARIALDVGKETVRFDNPLLPETRSEMVLPLRSRGRVIGAMTAHSAEEAAFDAADAAVMQTMADQVAVALDNARLFAESQAAFEAERRAYGEISRQAWADLLRSRPVAGYRYETEKTQVTRLSDGGQRPESAQDLPEVALPVRVHGAVIGTITAHKPTNAGDWTSDEVGILEELADQLGIALESARLYQDTQRRAATEQLSGEVTRRMRESLDLETVLSTAVHEISTALGLTALDVRLSTAEELE
jgi:GAF domain-containing protein/HAMP domain-containing protein